MRLDICAWKAHTRIMPVPHMMKFIIPARMRNKARATLEAIRNAALKISRELFASRKLKHLKGNHLLINFGCGQHCRQGWCNVDRKASDKVYYCDFKGRIPLETGSVLHIHCEHFLEHLDYDRAKEFLAESYRVLENNGSMRVILSDSEKYFKAYCNNDAAFFEELKYLGGTPQPMETRMEIINQMFRMGGDHRFAWDWETLLLQLKRAGFKRIERSEFGKTDPRLNIDIPDHWRQTESIYLDAYKII